MNIENSKSSETHKYFLNLSQILDLRISDKHVAFKLFYLLHVEKYKKAVQNQ